MAKIAGREVATSDVGILAGGVVVFIASFLPWLRWDFYYYRPITHIGWASGLLADLAIALALAVAALVAARIFANVRLPSVGPVGPALLNVLAGGVATLFTLIRLATASPYEARFGLYFALIGSAALTGFSVLALLASGEPIPGRGPGPARPGPWGPGTPPDQRPYGQPYGYQPAPPYTRAQQPAGQNSPDTGQPPAAPGLGEQAAGDGTAPTDDPPAAAEGQPPSAG